MRTAAKLLPILTGFALVVTLSGCGGRLAALHQGQAPAPAPSASVSGASSAGTEAPDSTSQLNDVQSDLDQVDGATTQSDADLSDGDQAAAQPDQ